jgi:WD40 repeat protein
VPGYEVLAELGRGGMGVVYRARQTKLGRVVALKMILVGAHAGEDDLARFKTEAEAIARLQHPHIIQIHEIGDHDGLPYFSLEFCGGGSLAQKLAGTPLPPKEAAALVETLARAMQAAHDKGVVHRDLKPTNVLLAEDGTPKVSDFGLARKLDEAGQTATGAVLGTPSYMAPEQASGKSKELGPACDVYALGALLYECLTGRPPFKAATALDTLMQVVSEDPVPPRQLQPKVPRDLETVCLTCLHKEAGKRYATAEALAEDLRRWQGGEPITARPVGRLERLAKWARRRPAAAALIAVSAVALAAALGGGAAFTLRLQDQVAQTEKARDELQAKSNELQAKSDDLDRTLRHSQRLLAGSRIQLADSAWREGHVGLVRDRLDEVPPGERFWDWRYLRRQVEGSLFTLYGAGGPVAYSPDGARLASSGGDRTVKVWDARTGQELRALQGHTATVECIAFSPDGARLASGSKDRRVKVWDARTGQELRTLQGDGWVNSVAFSPDGTRLASAGAEWPKPGEVKVWDARTGRELLTLRGHTDAVDSVAFSPDGRRLVSGSQDQTVKVWNARTGQELRTLQGDGWVTSVAFSPDGARLASGSGDSRLAGGGQDHTVKVWDARTGQELLTLRGHTEEVTGVAFSPDGARLASAGGVGGLPGEVKVWDAHSGRELLTLRGHTDAVRGVAFSPDGARLATGSDDKVEVWDLRTGRELLTLQGATSPVAFSPDGAHLATGSGDGTVKVWDARTGQVLRALQGHTATVECIAFSPDGARLATGSFDRTVRVWDARTGQELLTLRGHTEEVTGVAFSPDGTRLASGNNDRMVKVWDTRTGQELLTLRGHTDAVRGVAFSPDGARLASGNEDTVKVWDAHTGQEVLALQGHTDPVECIAFSPDGARLASASWDRTVKVWDPRTGRELLTLRGHTDAVRGLAFSPDGARLATGSQDKTVKVWDARTGRELLTLKGHTDQVMDVAFSPDGARLASGGWDDRTVRVWDARTGQELLTLRGHSGLVKSVAFSPDGLLLVSTDETGQQVAWDARTGERLPEVPLLPERPDPARSPDGGTFAWRDGSVIRLIDLQLSEDELAYRRRVTRLDPAWHAAEAKRFAQAGDWFAAAFHLRQRLQAPPDTVALRRDLALCQLAAGQQTAYRQTCAALVEQLDKGLAGDRAGVGLLALSPSGALAALPPLAVAVRLEDALRPAVARTVALGPGAVPAARLLSLADGAGSVTRALLLHRDGKNEDAVKLLADQTSPRALFVRALVEQARGRPAEAARALAQATGAGDAGLPWDERLERDLLRREAGALLKPPPGQAPAGRGAQ